MAKDADIGKPADELYNNPFSYRNEIIKKIPLIGEKFSYTKQTKEGQINIEKRQTTSVKKIEIPVTYEEIYIDGKKIDSYDEKEVLQIFSKIKNIIKSRFSQSKNQGKDNNLTDKQTGLLKVKYYDVDNNISNGKENAESRRSIPSSSNKKNPKIENVITLWGEEIIINKRKVKLGEFVIKKYEVTETKKIDVELITEKLTIHQPNASKEEIF
jgi:stress response protein YsnF